MGKKYKDFDKFFKENYKPSFIEIKLFGKKYKIQEGIPASYVLYLRKALRNGEQAIANDDLIDMAVQLVGSDTLNEWTDKGLKMDQLGDIVMWLAEQIHSGQQEEGKQDQGK